MFIKRNELCAFRKDKLIIDIEEAKTLVKMEQCSIRYHSNENMHEGFVFYTQNFESGPFYRVAETRRESHYYEYLVTLPLSENYIFNEHCFSDTSYTLLPDFTCFS